MAAIPAEIEALLQGHLVSIARLFKAPRITLVVRSPDEGNARGDLILGNDDPLAVEAVFRARIIDESTLFAESPEQSRLVTKERSRNGFEGPQLQCGGEPDGYQPRRGRG